MIKTLQRPFFRIYVKMRQQQNTNAFAIVNEETYRGVKEILSLPRQQQNTVIRNANEIYYLWHTHKKATVGLETVV